MRYVTFILKFMKNKRIRNKGAIILGYAKLNLMKALGLSPKGMTRLLGYRVHYGDLRLLCGLFKEIFILRLYDFESKNDSPRIIDAGANIGLATLFFKDQYPQATVICFEPEPSNFALLKKNVEDNQFAGLELRNAALADHEGTMTLYVRNDVGGGDIGASAIEELRHHFHEKNDIREITVPVERLSPYLDKEVDLLKIDVEGSEGGIFRESAHRFSCIHHVNMEYHYLCERNPLSSILSVLEEAGHVYGIQGKMSDDPRETYVLWIKSKRIS